MRHCNCFNVSIASLQHSLRCISLQSVLLLQPSLSSGVPKSPMGQVFSSEPNHIPYDANGWRRLSWTYLNQLNENGEQINGESRASPSLRRSRPTTPNASRQSSFGSKTDLNRQQWYESRHSFRITGHQSEQVVLQEYQPSKRPSGVPSQQTRPSRETDFPPIEPENSINPIRTPTNGDREVHRNHERTQRSETNSRSGANSGYVDLAISNQTAPQAPPGGKGSHSADGVRINGAPGQHHDSVAFPHRVAPPPPDFRTTRVEQLVVTKGPNGYSDEHDYQYSGPDQRPERTQSPKSSTTWNTSSDDYQSSKYSDPTHPNQYDSHNYILRHQENRSSNRNDNPLQRNGQKHLQMVASGGISSGSSRQSSGRAGVIQGDHYIPYNDYFMDRKLQGKTGANSYSDFSGYSKNSQQKARNRIGWTKVLFIVLALLNVASTIWNSIYMQMKSKQMELGFSIQDKKYSMSDVQRHLWEGFIITGQVLANLANIIAIYGALVNRYWIIWTYTWLMILYGMFGSVSEFTRGSYTSWLLPLISGQLAIILTHKLAIYRKYNSFR